MYVAKTKALISCTVTTQLICALVFAYAKSRFSHDVAQIVICMILRGTKHLKNLTLQILFNYKARES